MTRVYSRVVTAELPVAADAVLSALDHTWSPCDDFYAFACGHFGDSHPIPEGQLLWDNFQILQNAMDTLSRGELTYIHTYIHIYLTD
jgi:predicted metalloendopeptidase